MDIYFSSALHKSLYNKTNNNLLMTWDDFLIQYPEFKKYKNLFLQSRIKGNSSITLEIPWINFLAIDYLNEVLLGAPKVFEYGMGGSTIFFAKKNLEVISVEHNKSYYEEVNKLIRQKYKKQSIQLFLSEPKTDSIETKYVSNRSEYYGLSFKDYVHTINQFPDQYFDLVLVDGRCRIECCKIASTKIKKNGVLILDNSDYMHYQSGIKDLDFHFLKNWKKKDILSPGPFSQVIGWQTTYWVNTG